MLILDEATSSIDTRTEALHRERHGCPYGEPDGFRHRSPAFHSEKFQGHPGSGKGKIIERGDHQELLEEKGAIISYIQEKWSWIKTNQNIQACILSRKSVVLEMTETSGRNEYDSRRIDRNA
ncbi:MAG: hypothetical protein ACLR2E_03030 [Lachnospiraceae bacterium]